MTPATVSYIRTHGVLPNLTMDELLAECRSKENSLIEISAEMMQIAEALWPEGDSERPADMHDAGVTGAELVAGVQSLWEYVDRVMEENTRLREELAKVAT
jgi:hypothetical protein